MAEEYEFDVSTDDGFAAFFLATFAEAYEYADHLCGHEADAAEELVRLVFGWARRHAQQGRVTRLSDEMMQGALRNAWTDQQAGRNAPPPPADSVWAIGGPPRKGLYEELYLELFGEAPPTFETARTRVLSTADDDEEGAPGRRLSPYRMAAYAVMAGVIVLVLAVTLGGSDTPTGTTTVTTTSSPTSTEAPASSTSPDTTVPASTSPATSDVAPSGTASPASTGTSAP